VWTAAVVVRNPSRAKKFILFAGVEFPAVPISLKPFESVTLNDYCALDWRIEVPKKFCRGGFIKMPQGEEFTEGNLYNPTLLFGVSGTLI